MSWRYRRGREHGLHLQNLVRKSRDVRGRTTSNDAVTDGEIVVLIALDNSSRAGNEYTLSSGKKGTPTFHIPQIVICIHLGVGVFTDCTTWGLLVESIPGYELELGRTLWDSD